MNDPNRFLVIDCRGCSPVEFSLKTVIQATGESKFEDILLQDGEFYDYDEKNQAQVSITEVKTRFERIQ